MRRSSSSRFPLTSALALALVPPETDEHFVNCIGDTALEEAQGQQAPERERSRLTHFRPSSPPLQRSFIHTENCTTTPICTSIPFARHSSSNSLPCTHPATNPSFASNCRHRREDSATTTLTDGDGRRSSSSSCAAFGTHFTQVRISSALGIKGRIAGRSSVSMERCERVMQPRKKGWSSR